MDLKIITGPANSGKSQKLCREITQAAKRAPKESFIAVVPEQFTLQMQRRIVETSEDHAVMNIDIVSFNRLALKVFSDLGINLNEILDDTSKALVLRRVLDQNADKLSLYRKKIRMEGFIDEMKSLMTELKTYGISDEDLKAAQSRFEEEDPLLFQKLHDVRLIYNAFNEEIKDTYTTSEEVPDLFAKNLYFSERIKNVHVYLDGFTGFTPVQYKIIEGLLSVCKSVTCTVTAPQGALCGSCSETDIFRLPYETYSRLIDTASKLNIEAQTISYEPVSEKQAKEDLVNSASGNQARIFECEAENISEEVFFAAQEISRLVREENFRYREIAVVTGDMKKYYPYLEKAFRQFKIPAFIDHKAGISDNRFARYVLFALRIVKERFSFDSVFAYLKCGLSGFSADETDRFENYCLEFGIKGPVSFSRPFLKNRSLRGTDKKAWDLEEINSLRERFMSGISAFAARTKRAKTAKDYKNALEVLFEANNIEEKLAGISARFKEDGNESAAQEYEQIFGIIDDLLEKANVLSKESSIALDDYIKIIQGGISEIKIGLIPATADMVTAGDLERSRLNKIKALFILGASEGSLPKAAEGKGILDPRERQKLKDASLTLAPSALENFYSQRYYLYLMLNKPAQYLYLCRPALAQDGQRANRSEIFDELDEYIPNARLRLEKYPCAEGRRVFNEDAGLDLLAGQIGKFAQSGEESAIDKQLLGYFCENRPARMAKIIESAFYANKESNLDSNLEKALYGDVLKGSVSRFESFNECAFRHFLRYGLCLEERPEYEIKAASLGTIYHSALEKYVRAVQKAGFDIRNIPDDKSHVLARAAAAAAVSEEESQVLLESARGMYQANRTIEVVVKTTDIIRKKIKEGNYDIAAVEQRFSTCLDDGSIFSGIIDRIDIYDTGEDIYVNIVDYKTGSKKFDLNETVKGTGLQLPVYLGCALDIIQAAYPQKDVRPAGVYYFLVRDEFESADKKEKEDQNLKGYADDEERMRALMDYAKEKLLETGERIKKGEVMPSPIKENGKIKVCEYCDYKEVCRFKEGEFQAQARQIRRLGKNELEEEIYG